MGTNIRKSNIMKMILNMALVVCLSFSCFTMLVNAASGKIMFTDPSTKVGEVVEVRGVLQSTAAIEDREIVMSYDTSMLKFQSGDNVTESTAGQLTYSLSDSVENDGRVEFLMTFQALKEGTAKIEVKSYKAWTAGANYEVIECTVGSSAITIGAGEAPTDNPTDNPTDVPTQAEQVIVDGVTYTFSGAFAQEDIPEGFQQTTMEYAGKECSVVFSDKYGMYLGYLVNDSNEGEFYLYVQENATFAPYAEITVSDKTSIILLSDVEGIELPESYVTTTVLVNGVAFPAWQNTEKSELCILYAVNSNGLKSLYQLDSNEGTYQKFEAPAAQEKPDDSIIGKLVAAIEGNLDKVILGTGIGFIVCLVVMIVLGIKLYNRNAELDDVYEEYGIDLLDVEEETQYVEKENKKKEKKENKKKENKKKENKKKEMDEEESEVDEEDFSIVPDDAEAAEDFEASYLSEGFRKVKEEEIRVADSEIQDDFDYKETALNQEDFFDDDDDELGYEIDFIDLDD